MQNNNPIDQYFEFRREVDVLCRQLSEAHSLHMNCRAGCDECCMDFSIFPVEYHAIMSEAGQGLTQKNNTPSLVQCPFLVDHKCLIYHSRPIICRTQGLPLLFMNDDNWELSACEFNFNGFDPEGFTFDNTFPQDKINSRLYMINQLFLQSPQGEKYREGQLIPLKNLGNKLH